MTEWEIPWRRNTICALVALNTSKQLSVTLSYISVQRFPVWKIGAYVCVCLVMKTTLKDSYYHSPCPFYSLVNEGLAIWSDVSKVTQVLHVIEKDPGSIPMEQGWGQKQGLPWAGWWPSTLGEEVADRCIKVTTWEPGHLGTIPTLMISSTPWVSNFSHLGLSFLTHNMNSTIILKMTS